MSPDKVVALIGVVMAMAILANGGTFRDTPWSKRLRLGAIWVGIFAAVALIASYFNG